VHQFGTARCPPDLQARNVMGKFRKKTNSGYMKRFYYLTLILTVCLTGCNRKSDPFKLVPDHVTKFAENFIEQIHKGNIDTCLTMVSNDMKDTNGSQFLNDLYNQIKYSKLDSFKIVNSNVTSVLGADKFNIYNLEYEYYVNNRFQYYNYRIKEKSDSLIILGFQAGFYDTSLADQNAMTLKGKGFAHYFFLLFCILIPIFCIITVIFAIKSKVKLKWLWIVGIVIGVMKFKLNWTTGEFDYQIINASLLGAGFLKVGLVGQWQFFLSVPIFAIIFWFKRASANKELREEAERINVEPIEVNSEVKIVFQDTGSGILNNESANEVKEIIIDNNSTQEDIIKMITERTNIPQEDLICYTAPKLIKIVRYLSILKPDELIVFHDNNIKLIEKERWDGIVASGNADKFKIIYKKV
jgi:hypothetical protein